MEQALSSVLFYVFAVLAVLSAFGVVAFRNPVSSALSMALCFAFCAAIYFGMGAPFIGIVQIIVYAGAVLVLFLFIIMMMDVKVEERSLVSLPQAIVGTAIAALFGGMVGAVALSLPNEKEGKCPVKVAWAAVCGEDETVAEAVIVEPSAENYGGALPALTPSMKYDTQLLGVTLFGRYNIPFAILSFAFLAGSVGALALVRKLRKD